MSRQFDLVVEKDSEGFFVATVPPTFRKDVTPLNRKPGGLMEQSNASLQRGDQG